jgi:subtilisin family serine protease
VIAGLQEAVKDGADVVSMSFGGLGFSLAEKHAIAAVAKAGLVLVASAGNEPNPVAGARNYPAGFSEVISVGATDIDNNMATFSTFGGHQDIVAPGVETPTTYLQNEGRDSTLEENSPTAGLDFEPNPMQFTALGAVTANLVNAGLGQPADFAGVDCTDKIALISRGAITFAAKVDNAIADGCDAAVIYNNAPGNFSGTLGVPKTIPAVSLSQAEGQSLVAQLAGGAVNMTLRIIANDYTSFSGTSASAPYVSGVAALVLSANPSLSNDQVRNILDATARPLGPSQRSIFYGHGLVDALGAVNSTP